MLLTSDIARQKNEILHYLLPVSVYLIFVQNRFTVLLRN